MSEVWRGIAHCPVHALLRHRSLGQARLQVLRRDRGDGAMPGRSLSPHMARHAKIPLAGGRGAKNMVECLAWPGGQIGQSLPRRTVSGAEQLAACWSAAVPEPRPNG